MGYNDGTRIMSADFIKNNTIVENNVNSNLILTTIDDVEEISVKSVLGSKLYDKIIEDIKNNNLTGDYRTLTLDYVAPMEKFYVVRDLLPHILYNVANRSVEKEEGDTSKPISAKELEYLQSSYENKGATMEERTENYLYDNQEKFPEYTDSYDLEDVNPNHDRNTVINGVYLGSHNTPHKYYYDSDKCCYYYMYNGRYRYL